MFDEYSEFYFAQEDHGNFLHIYIPGKLPMARGEKQIKWCGNFANPSKENYKKEAIILRKNLKKNGLLKDLPQRQLPGYSSFYPYSVAPMGIWEITPDLKDLIYVRNDVAYKMKHTLWFPLWKKLQENIGQYDYIQLTLPKLPKLMLEEHLNEWYKNNTLEAGFIKRLEKLSQKTMIDIMEDDNSIRIRPVNHPFVNQPARRIEYSQNQEKSRENLPCQDMLKLKQQVLERDVYLLKGLTDSERKKMAHASLSDVEQDSTHQLHWIHWPSLNGGMNKDNAIIVTSNIKQMYQFAVQTPLESFLKSHGSDLAKKGKPVFVELPIPYNGYRSAPIKKIKTKHQNRSELKQKLQKALETDR
jgi:hypothetical protein